MSLALNDKVPLRTITVFTDVFALAVLSLGPRLISSIVYAVRFPPSILSVALFSCVPTRTVVPKVALQLPGIDSDAVVSVSPYSNRAFA